MWKSKVANNVATQAQALVAQCKAALAQFSGPITLGYSGGVDSSVLLHALLKAGAQGRLSAVHVHHGLQPLADTWLAYCEQECERLGVPFHGVKLNLPGEHNIEGRARRERRAALLAHTSPQGRLALAQHQNDQAETLLLQLLRGAGPQGLGAMAPLSDYEGYTLWRPLLHLPKTMLAAIARHWELTWVEDPTNEDVTPDRNYLRQQVIPLLEQRWPQLVPTLARNAQLQQEAAHLQQALAHEDWQRLSINQEALCLQGLQTLSKERQRNLIYRWILARGFMPPSQKVLARLWRELIPAREDATPKVAWPYALFCRHGGALYLMSHEEHAPTRTHQNITLQENQTHTWGQGMLSVKLTTGAAPLRLPATLNGLTLAPVPKGARLKVRGYHRCVREAWRAQGIPPWRREQIPGLFFKGELVAVPNVGVVDGRFPQEGEKAWALNWQWFALESRW